MTDLNTIAPKVSIILPVYNAAPFLSESIESLLNQTLSDFELIIVDDCSTDGSGALIMQYAGGDSRIRVLEHTSNRGVSAARNTALDEVRGEFVAMMDADDICRQDRLACQVDYIERYSLDVCGSYMQGFGTKVRDIKYPQDNATIRLNFLCYGRTIAHPSAMIRHSIIGELRYNLEYSYGEDYDFWVRLAMSTQAVFGNVPEQLVRYRKHVTQASNTLSYLNRSVVVNVLHCALSSHIPGLSLPLVEFHYRLVKERHKLGRKDVVEYGEFLDAIGQVVPATEQEFRNYWYDFCYKRLRRDINSWRLFRFLLGRLQPGTQSLQLLMLLRSIFL